RPPYGWYDPNYLYNPTPVLTFVTIGLAANGLWARISRSFSNRSRRREWRRSDGAYPVPAAMSPAKSTEFTTVSVEFARSAPAIMKTPVIFKGQPACDARAGVPIISAIVEVSIPLRERNRSHRSAAYALPSHFPSLGVNPGRIAGGYRNCR